MNATVTQPSNRTAAWVVAQVGKSGPLAVIPRESYFRAGRAYGFISSHRWKVTAMEAKAKLENKNDK